MEPSHNVVESQTPIKKKKTCEKGDVVDVVSALQHFFFFFNCKNK